MDFPVDPIISAKAYKYKAELLFKEYLLADSYVLYTSVLVGLLMCKLSYDFTHIISSVYFKGYDSLTKMKKIEWNNRGMSTVHAVFITMMSVYLVFLSDLFSDQLDDPVTFRSSHLSNFTLGVSVGYFIADLAMIFWFYPSLGGMEYLYTYTFLISETTTPGINLRWFLDVAGKKNSKAYIVNGVAMFVTWLMVRIVLFIYLFYHILTNYDQVKQMDTFACVLISVAPIILFTMNVIWFSKIVKGLKKTLVKRHAE